jgi:hypothetical protein
LSCRIRSFVFVHVQQISYFYCLFSINYLAFGFILHFLTHSGRSIFTIEQEKEKLFLTFQRLWFLQLLSLEPYVFSVDCVNLSGLAYSSIRLLFCFSWNLRIFTAIWFMSINTLSFSIHAFINDTFSHNKSRFLHNK